MEKFPHHSPDLTDQNIEALLELFPNVSTETQVESGEPRRAIDFDLLRQELSDHLVEGPQERYQLDWPGKRQALLTANAPIAKTLRPVREESVDFDNTKNLFIEGDNLDALKLLQESYLGKVKLIYIDPPYNTGRDFVYDDDFAENSSDYLEKSKQIDDDGNRLKSNPESNGRFHSDWLSMMYPRLKLAKRLLSEDGVVFISLDDGEISNLRHLCDEIFGERQFIGHVVWKKRNTPPNDRAMGAQHDFMLVYGKQGVDGLSLRPRSQEQLDRYKNPDNHPRGPWVAGDLTANVKGGRYVDSLNYPIVNPKTGAEHWPSNGGNWRFNSERVEELIREDAIYFGKDGLGAPKIKRFLCDIKPGTTWTTLWDFAPFNATGSQEMESLLGSSSVFESPKPVGLLRHVLEAGTRKDSIVLDFFAGSSSMAHAVLSQNKLDGGERRFIMIQLDEGCPPESEAAKAGFNTIADLSRERIRRAIDAISSEIGGTEVGLDIGFRSLKVDSTSFSQINKPPDALLQERLLADTSSVKDDRSSEDILFESVLRSGLEVSLPIKAERSGSFKIFDVEEGSLIMCVREGGGERERERENFHPRQRDRGSRTASRNLSRQRLCGRRGSHQRGAGLS